MGNAHGVKTVLVLEDECSLLEAIKDKLETSHCGVVGARSVDEAWGCLNSGQQVSAIWVDHYLLGEEDGYSFVKKLKDEHSQWQKTPIFLVSNTASTLREEDYKRIGVHQCFRKSDHSLSEIVDCVISAMEQPQS